MRDEARDDRWMRRLAFPVSLTLHLFVAALLVFGLPESLPQPRDEEEISVELVPPPEPPRNGKSEPIPVLQPVIQFGEKDAGPKLSPEGNSAEEPSGASMALRDLDKPDLAQAPSVTTLTPSGEAPQPRKQETPASAADDAADAQQASKLRQAKVLFSQRANGKPVATIAMGPAPRDVRVARLCATELKEQLLHASPSYFPEIVPFDRLKEGTVVQSLSTAFRSNWEWYNLGYRCEVDTDATKVVSFAFDIGKALTPEEWKRRGLPSQ
ncbi:MAG: DUF930 domain-containing protein [Hyphomicrobiales bacterium]|nr:DUF930 domain-containing protein [Hyphomicrobiales bacterium]